MQQQLLSTFMVLLADNLAKGAYVVVLKVVGELLHQSLIKE